MRKRTVVVATLVLLNAWYAYDTVLSDATPTQAVGEASACEVYPCMAPLTVIRVHGSMFSGQTFDVSWRDGHVLRVGCHRVALFFGPMRCQESK